MGSNGSKSIRNLISATLTGSKENTQGSSAATTNVKPSPFVFVRHGSLYIDEDGEMAHEFYVEIPPKSRGKKATMKRVTQNLRPQGDVEYEIPRLNCEFPVILYQG